MRKTFGPAMKAKAALAALKGDKTLTQLSSEYEVHPNQVSKWKKRVLELLPSLFERKSEGKENRPDPAVDELYKQMGQLQVKNDWLKKNLRCLSVNKMREMTDKGDDKISICGQCDLLGICRSSAYYQPVPISESDLRLMNRTDEIFTKYPFMGSRKICEYLNLEGWVGSQPRQSLHDHVQAWALCDLSQEGHKCAESDAWCLSVFAEGCEN